MANHEELINEIKTLETLSPQERLEYARKRRVLQLQRYNKQEEKERLHPPLAKANKGRPVRFKPNISLIEAAARNDKDEVLLLIKQGISPNLQNDDGLSALHQAVIEDCMDVVETLLENGADANIQDDDLWTPLHAAVACGNLDIAMFLVEKGASLVLLNADGNMPIDLVEEFEDIERYLDEEMTRQGYTEDELESLRNVVADQMLEDLEDSLAKDRDINVKNEHGATAMHIAAAYGYEEVIEFLLDHGAKIAEVDNDGWQPIHAAACWGHDSIIEILVNHGADLDCKTYAGETPIDLTEDDDLRDIIVELKESGRKTKEIKRTQSNSSRTLCVRRSSLVQKHAISSNDAKNEGMYRQTPEFLKVYIDPDTNDESAAAAVTNGVESPGNNASSPLEFEGKGSPTGKGPVSPNFKTENNKNSIHIIASSSPKTRHPETNNTHPGKEASISTTKKNAPLPPKQQAPIAKRESDSPAVVKTPSIWERASNYDDKVKPISNPFFIPPKNDDNVPQKDDENASPKPENVAPKVAEPVVPKVDENKPVNNDEINVVIPASKNTAETKRRSRRQSIKKACCSLM